MGVGLHSVEKSDRGQVAVQQSVVFADLGTADNIKGSAVLGGQFLDLFDGEVECPRHGSPFDLATGEPGALPATAPVPVYPATVRDGVVYLTIEGAS